MEKAKRARKAETPKRPSLSLRLRAPYLYPDRAYLAQERFSYDLVRSAWAEEFREGHEQMDRQEKQIAHELETILSANLHKTAPKRRFMPNLPIRHPHGAAGIVRY